MKKTITPGLSNTDDFDLNMYKKNKSVQVHPKKQTIDFLRQFARSYHVENQLPGHLSGMILN